MIILQLFVVLAIGCLVGGVLGLFYQVFIGRHK